MHTDVLAHGSTALLGDGARSMLGNGLRLAIGVVWLAAAVSKARTPAATRDSALRLLGNLPWAAVIAARLIVPLELALAVMLIVEWHAGLAALTSAVLFVLFAVFLARAAVRDAMTGSAGGCGCFGRPKPAQAFDHLSGTRAIARNLVLAVLAVAAMSGT